MTGWTLEPSYPLSSDTEVPMPPTGRWAAAGMVRGGCPDLAWRLLDAQHWASPRLARRQRVFLVADFGGRRAPEILFKPRPMHPLPAPGGARRLSAPAGDRGPFLDPRGRVPVARPFQGFRMRGAAKHGAQTPLPKQLSDCQLTLFPLLLAGARQLPLPFGMRATRRAAASVSPRSWRCERHHGAAGGVDKVRGRSAAKKSDRPSGTRPWATPSLCPAPSTSWRGSVEALGGVA